jgi:LysR family transcriptional regulator, hydrogen peroxide-inducible genes activator
MIALSLRDLRYLVAVADHGHFGRAAGTCAVSQPALSAQIKKVEDVLGVTVFERTNRRVLVTPIGRAVVEQARVVLEEAGKLSDLARAAREPLAGPFHLGVIATLGPYLLPHLLAPLRRAFPGLGLALREGVTEDLLTELGTGALDAVLAALPIADPGLETTPLFFEPFVLAIPRGHPLAGHRGLTPAVLRAEEMVLLEDGHCLRDQALEVCPRGRRQPLHPLQATSLETLRHLVASGAGYSLLPRLAVTADRRVDTLLAYREFTGEPPGRTIALVWRRRSSRRTDVDALAAFIRKHLPRRVTVVADERSPTVTARARRRGRPRTVDAGERGR